MSQIQPALQAFAIVCDAIGASAVEYGTWTASAESLNSSGCTECSGTP
jgi:hypothetical protein